MNFNRILLFPQLFLDPFLSSYQPNFISSLFFKHISSRVCASHICKVTQTGAIPLKIVTLPFLMTVNCQQPLIEVWGFILTSPLHFVCSELLELKCMLRKFVKVYHILAILKCTVQWCWENSFYCAIIASRHLQYSLHFVKLKIHNHLTVNPSFSLVVPHNNHSIVCLCGLEFSKYLNKVNSQCISSFLDVLEHGPQVSLVLFLHLYLALQCVSFSYMFLFFIFHGGVKYTVSVFLSLAYVT